MSIIRFVISKSLLKPKEPNGPFLNLCSKLWKKKVKTQSMYFNGDAEIHRNFLFIYFHLCLFYLFLNFLHSMYFNTQLQFSSFFYVFPKVNILANARFSCRCKIFLQMQDFLANARFSCQCKIFLPMQDFLANARFSCKCKIFLPLNVKVLYVFTVLKVSMYFLKECNIRETNSMYFWKKFYVLEKKYEQQAEKEGMG